MAEKTEPKTYKILRLESENIKRIKVACVTPDSDLVEISGENDQGKSSLIDTIFWALGGEAVIQASPIRDGENKARAFLDLGDLKVTRTFTRKEGGYTTSLIVENADGARYSTPQTILKALTGRFTFDPLAFANLKDPKEQVGMLKALVPGLDFTALDKANKADYDERTAVNRQAKDLRAQAAAIVLPEDFDGDEVDEAALTEKLAQAGRIAGEIADERASRERAIRLAEEADAKANDYGNRAADLRAQADDLDKIAEGQRADAKAIREELAGLPPLATAPDTEALKIEIGAARQKNAIARQAAAKFDLTKTAEAKEKAADALTKAMADRDAAKAKAISDAKLPVPGLGFDDNGVTLNNLPFEQASKSIRLRTSIAIAAAMNPRLRIALVQDAAFLDTKSFAALGEFAAEHDIQIWAETLESGRPGAVLIEDGLVVGAEAPAKADAEATDMFGRTDAEADADREAEPADMGAQ